MSANNPMAALAKALFQDTSAEQRLVIENKSRNEVVPVPEPLTSKFDDMTRLFVDRGLGTVVSFEPIPTFDLIPVLGIRVTDAAQRGVKIEHFMPAVQIRELISVLTGIADYMDSQRAKYEAERENI